MTPSQVLRHWTADPLVLAGVVAAAVLYASGVRRLWRRGLRGRGVRRWQAWCFGGGLLAVVVALLSPLDAMSQDLLSAHMAQHFVLIMVASPLLVLGSPGVAFAAALPGSRRAVHRWGRHPLARGTGRTLSNPVATWCLALVALWTWHAPVLYQAALRSPAVHALEHLSFLGTGALFWWTAIHPSGRRRLARGADVLYVFTGGFQGAVLGALFVFASSPLYPYYSAARTGPWGLTPLADQQVAGAIMWVPSTLVTLAVAGLLFVQWLRAMEREMRRAEGRRPLVQPGALR